MIERYFNQVKKLLDTYRATHFVLQVQVQFDMRLSDQGYMHGTSTFRDESVLHFREYLDGYNGVLHKEMYTYHYQDTMNKLIFRYDNARHRPPLGMMEHNHTPDGIIEIPAPS